MSYTKEQRAGAHVSRNQESRDATTIHDDAISFEDSGPLPDIQARPGFTQRWIRIKKGADDDSRNMYNATRKGWAPRAADTVSKSLQFLVVQRAGLGGVIGTHDMVLMERHEEIQKQAARHNKDARRSLEKAVKNNLFSEHKSLGGSNTGFSAPDMESSSSVERGRRATIADD